MPLFGLRPEHLIIILVVALLIFGPSRLPEIGKSFGKMIKEFQGATKEAAQGFQEETQKPVEAKKEEPAPAPVAAAVATMPCKNCGKPIQTGSKFCPECGTAQ